MNLVSFAISTTHLPWCFNSEVLNHIGASLWLSHAAPSLRGKRECNGLRMKMAKVCLLLAFMPMSAPKFKIIKHTSNLMNVTYLDYTQSTLGIRRENRDQFLNIQLSEWSPKPLLCFDCDDSLFLCFTW